MSEYRKMVSVPFPPDEYESLKARAGAQPLAAFIRDVLNASAETVTRAAKPTASTERLPCGCSDATHPEAERRVEVELAPRLRRKIAPRDPAEGPHEYIARFWGADELKRDFYLDLNKALGWIKDDDGAEDAEDYS